MNASLVQAYAQTSGGQGGGIMSMLLMFGGMFAVIYFIMIRPQQKQQRRHQELIASLKKGDEVNLSCGIIGKIFAVDEQFIVLEIGDKTKVRVIKQAIQGLHGGSAPMTVGARK